MNTILFLIATGLTVFITFIFFGLFGSRSNNIFITAQEKQSWDEKLSGIVKKLLTTTNIFGAVTSLATLLFLTGSAKLFGIFAFATGITFAFSSMITNPITNKFLEDKNIKKRYDDNEQVGGVIASLFWDDTKHGKQLAAIIKYISIFATFAIIWLEVSLFSNFSSAYLHIDSINSKTIIATITFFIIFYFLIQYGLRGFVFADLFHTPVIVLMGVVLIVILLFMFFQGDYTLNFQTFLIPVLPWGMGAIFCFHVLVLNLFQVICTEPHWYRLWLFKNVEITSQSQGVIGTGLVWIFFLFVGFSTFAITGQFGQQGIEILLSKFSVSNPYFIFFFWMAAAGALFSTVDAQLYSILLISRYKVSNGTLPITSKRFNNPFVVAVSFSVAFGIFYFLATKYKDLFPFEKILFVIVPFSTVLLPLFIQKYTDRVPKLKTLLTSIFGFITVAAIGFCLPQSNYDFTLSAIFFPALVSIIIVLTPKKQTNKKI